MVLVTPEYASSKSISRDVARVFPRRGVDRELPPKKVSNRFPNPEVEKLALVKKSLGSPLKWVFEKPPCFWACSNWE